MSNVLQQSPKQDTGEDQIAAGLTPTHRRRRQRRIAALLAGIAAVVALSAGLAGRDGSADPQGPTKEFAPIVTTGEPSVGGEGGVDG